MNHDIASLSDSLLGCVICMGGDEATTTAANLAIGFMGVLTLLVLGSILKFMHHLSRQAKLAASEPDPLGELTAGDPR